MLTQKALRHFFEYDETTGLFCSNPRSPMEAFPNWFFDPAGTPQLRIFRSTYKVCDLAWIYMNGPIPNGKKVIHKDMARDNNRIDNLLLATKHPKRFTLTQARLKDILKYEPSSGNFYWRNPAYESRRGVLIKPQPKGRGINVKLGGKSYRTHRLAWLYMTGDFPEYGIRHKDNDRMNNAWDNLEAETSDLRGKGGAINRKKSRIAGVNWDKESNEWQVTITLKVGTSPDFTEAVKARWDAEKEYDIPNCMTDSSAYLYLKDAGIIE